MKITIQPTRDAALLAGFAALLERLPHGYSFELFRESLADWDVRAFHDGKRAVGMLMVRGDELHVAVLPEVRGKWLSRRLIRESFAPILAQYGRAKTSVAEGNAIGIDFVRRIRAGFADLTYDPVTALIGGGVSLLGGAMQADASQSAADTAANAQNRSADLQKQMFDTQNAQQAPWRQAGENALATIGGGFGAPGTGDFTYGGIPNSYFAHQFGANDLNANLAPNWKFALEQGQGAAKNALNLTGGLGGNFGKGLVDYTLNKAGDQYQQAYANYTTNQANIFNRLSTVAGFGSGANQQSAQLAGALGPNIGNSIANAGAAQAAGTVGAANALSGGAGNALGWYQAGNAMNQGGATPISQLSGMPGQFDLNNVQYGG